MAYLCRHAVNHQPTCQLSMLVIDWKDLVQKWLLCVKYSLSIISPGFVVYSVILCLLLHHCVLLLLQQQRLSASTADLLTFCLLIYLAFINQCTAAVAIWMTKYVEM